MSTSNDRRPVGNTGYIRNVPRSAAGADDIRPASGQSRRSGTDARYPVKDPRRGSDDNLQRSADTDPRREKQAVRKLAVILCSLLLVSVALALGITAMKKIRHRREAEQQQAVAQSTVTVTFPEGRTVRQYGALLEENGVCTADDFYAAMCDNDFTADFNFLPSNDLLQSREYPLEGYLYPDTYDFYIGENPVSVIKRFLRNFAARIPDELIDYANRNGEGFRNIDMSLDNAVILAAIIERESPTDNERAKIAACFWNRIENPSVSGTGGKLQSDATHYYPYVMTDVPEGFRSEYDTYNVKGLPKGPICNPSLSSIRAAVYPDTTCKAYFFYTDRNDNHYYAETYEQHLKNIQYCKDNGLT